MKRVKELKSYEVNVVAQAKGETQEVDGNPTDGIAWFERRRVSHSRQVHTGEPEPEEKKTRCCVVS